ncbi:MAG: hypothetical protein ABI835_07785 [Chloroflexota bacterium]
MKGWGFLLRVLLKAAVLFVVCNLVFALLNPIEALGRVSLYNTVLPGRERLPYGENPSEWYNLSLYNVPAMFASHVVTRPKAADEYRVFLIGDSSTWGWRLENRDTYAGIINEAQLTAADGRRVVAYNIGYPIGSLTKDLMLLDEAMQYLPDQIVWLVSLASFSRDVQVDSPITRNNAERVRALIARYNLQLDPQDSRLVETDFLGRTIVGQRRALADWLRLQLYGFSWAATGVDQAIPAEYVPRTSDFDTQIGWENFPEPTTLTADDLAFDVLSAGIERAGDVPILIVNEPTFISSGINSDLRYSLFYPRWVYDEYRRVMSDQVVLHGWRYLDTWDRIDPNEFTDAPVHLSPAGSRQLSGWLGEAITDLSSE